MRHTLLPFRQLADECSPAFGLGAVYIETRCGIPWRTHRASRTDDLLGYSLKLPTRESDAESMEIENAQDQSDNSADVSPLQAEREWISQAEQNVLDRLTQAGLVAPPSDFDKVSSR